VSRTDLPRLALLTALIAPAVQAGPTIPFGEQGSLQFNYAVQAWAQHASFTSPEHDGGDYDFFLRRNRFTILGQQSDLVGFYATVEAANDGKDGRDERALYFRDAYITVDTSDSLRFIVGNFKNTFSRENLEGCLESLTLDRGDISYTPFAGTRDYGAAVWGNLFDAALQYRLMVADGREDSATPRSTLRITGRVHYSLLDPEYDYGYRGTYLGTRKVLTFGAAYDFQADVAYNDFENREGAQDYQAWTIDGFFEYPFALGTVTASAAYFDYSTGDAINREPDESLPFNSESKGYYAKLGYLLPQKLGPGRVQPFLRLDDIAYRLTGGALDRRIATAGVNYLFDGQRLKLTLEHMRVDYENPDPTNLALQDNSLTTLGFQFAF